MVSDSERMTCLCNEVSDVFIDGTFKCCAKFFLHMYNIHGLCNGHVGHYVPLVFMFLPGKSASIYRSHMIFM